MTNYEAEFTIIEESECENNKIKYEKIFSHRQNK